MFNKKSFLQKAVIVMSVFWLAACQTPITTYETTYQLSEPRTVEGRDCIEQCQASKNVCQAQAMSGAQCSREYRACHQLCGGIVVEERVCVENCPEIA